MADINRIATNAVSDFADTLVDGDISIKDKIITLQACLNNFKALTETDVHKPLKNVILDFMALLIQREILKRRNVDMAQSVYRRQMINVKTRAITVVQQMEFPVEVEVKSNVLRGLSNL